MKNNLILNARKFFCANITGLLILPILTFIIIFISYGDSIQQILFDNPEFSKSLSLNNINIILQRATEIPYHVRKIGITMITYSFSIYLIWVLLFTIYTYKNLSIRNYNSYLIITEYIILLFIYIFIITPGLSLLINIIGYFLFFFILVVFCIYFIFYKELKHEEK